MVCSASQQAWFPDDATIKIEKQGSYAPQTITTEVTNFSDGGGDKTTESVAHFGGAFLTVTKPQEDFEVEFEVDVVDTTWSEVISGDVTEVTGSFAMVRSGGAQNPYKVKIEWVNSSTQEGYKIVYYNAYGVTFNKESPADDRLTGTISFKVSPSDACGSTQRIEVETINVTDAGVGSGATGSYGYYEAFYDTVHGYGVGSML